MKTGIKILSTDYYINEDTTICVIKAKINRWVFDLLFNKDIFKRVTRGFNNISTEFHVGEFTVVGKSVCCPSDTYNEVLGKRIAEGRAKRKLFIIANKFWKNVEDVIMDIAKKPQKLSRNCAELTKIEEEHLDYLMYDGE